MTVYRLFRKQKYVVVFYGLKQKNVPATDG